MIIIVNLQASAYQTELEHRQKSGLIPKDTFVLAVPDPSSARVGRYY